MKKVLRESCCYFVYIIKLELENNVTNASSLKIDLALAEIIFPAQL